MIFCLGHTMYQDSLKNSLTSGKASYIPNMYCLIDSDLKRSIDHMAKDFSECISLHLSHQMTD